MRLVDSGQIDLDSPVELYIAPWPLPASALPSNQVTIRRLLSRTAGVNPGNLGVRNPDAPALSTRDVLLGKGTNPAIEGAGPTRLELAAGERFLYSNPGYMLVQFAIEQQSGPPFAGFMKQQVLGPLGMSSSSFDWDQALRARTATPYLNNGSASPITILNDQATGSLFSTAPDLAKFVAAGVAAPSAAGLSPSAMSALYEANVTLPPIDVQGLASDSGALGHYIERLADGRSAIMNGGFAPGWMSQFYLIPDSGDGIVVLTNSDLGRAVIAEIVADWTAWRGLPVLKMTRTYALVGTIGPFVIGLLGLIALAIALQVATGLVLRRRRVGPIAIGQFARAVALLAPALALGYVWFGFARMIAMFALPWLEAPMTLVIAALCMALIASAVLPRASAASRSSFQTLFRPTP